MVMFIRPFTYSILNAVYSIFFKPIQTIHIYNFFCLYTYRFKSKSVVHFYTPNRCCQCRKNTRKSGNDNEYHNSNARG